MCNNLEPNDENAVKTRELPSHALTRRAASRNTGPRKKGSISKGYGPAKAPTNRSLRTETGCSAPHGC